MNLTVFPEPVFSQKAKPAPIMIPALLALATRCRFAASFLVLLALCFGAQARGTSYPPSQMTYQGYVVDGNGNPLATNAPANYDIIFRVFNAVSGGTSLWTEKQTATVDKGSFSVVLGNGAAYNSEPYPDLASVFQATDASSRYLEITVTLNGGTLATIAPRLQLVTSPYAFLSKFAYSLLNNDGSALGLLNGSSITSGTVADARLSSNVALLAANQTFAGNNVFSQYLQLPGGARLSDKPIYFRSGSDTNHGVGYASSFISGVDGPALFGYGGGVLGTTSGGAKTAVQWDNSGNVTVTGNLTVNGSGGVSAGGTIPIGGIIMWSGSIASIPSGWALCSGQTVNGHATPDLRDRFVLGAGNRYSPAATGGSESHTLSVNEMPAHNHSTHDAYFTEHNIYGYNFQNGTSWEYVTDGSQGVGSDSTDNDNNTVAYRNVTSTSTGGGAAFDIRPQYYALAFIMRVQ